MLIDNEINKSVGLIKKRIKLSLIPAFLICVIIWLMFLVDYFDLFNANFVRLGIYPLKMEGLKGIIFSPLVHASFSHLISNTVPLLILFSLLFYFYNPIAYKTILLLWIFNGFFTWVIGRSSFHIGASGLIFGLSFFLFFSGLFRKYIPLSAVSMIVAFMYGSTIWSILPVAEYIDVNLSWEAHLSGAVAGLIVAIIFRKQGPQKPEVHWDEDDSIDEDATDENTSINLNNHIID